MTPNEFVMWLKGFSEACHHLNPTPQQWEKVMETLKTVKEQEQAYGEGCKVYTYPYQGYKGDNTLVNDAKKQLND